MPRLPPDAAALAAAYRAARYVAHLSGATRAIAVGERAVDVETAIDVDSFAFITAWNPRSEPRDEGANRVGEASLAAELDALGVRRWPMLASDADGGHVEQGWLLADIDVDVLDGLARAFDPAGTLYWRRGEPVRLRMSVAAPPGARPDATDWLE